MVKPLIPIIFLAMWAILFEDKIWPDWENEEAIKFFDKGELQWEHEMLPELAKDSYRFDFKQFIGNANSYRNDTLIVDNNVFCLMENLEVALFDSVIGRTITIKGRVLNYDRNNKKIRLDRCFIQSL